MNRLTTEVWNKPATAFMDRLSTGVLNSLAACIHALMILIAFSACGGADGGSVELTGEIKGMKSDTLYLYGIDQFYEHTDTIAIKNGKFKVRLQADTLTDARLCLSNGEEYPLFFRPGDRIVVKGDTSRHRLWQVTGNEENLLLTHFFATTQGIHSAQALRDSAASFIRRNPDNLASTYLLNRYFIQSERPDLKQIKQLIETMSSDLRDRPFIDRLQSQLTEQEKVEVGRISPYFSLPDKNGNQLTRGDFRDQFLLLLFWASWDQPSREANHTWRKWYTEEKKEYESLKKKYDAEKRRTERSDGSSNRSTNLKKGTYSSSQKVGPKEPAKLTLIGVSLDGSREQWLAAVKSDSINWEQGCELDGWSSKIVAQFGILALPSNILIDAQGKILGRNLTPEEVKSKLANR